MEPFEQGGLDGLCGVYSIINSAKIINGLNGTDSEKLFKDIISHLDRTKNLASIITEGMNINVIGEVMNNVKSLNFERKMPFRGYAKTSLDEFWSSMQEFLAVRNRTILLGLGGHYDHWSVVTEVSDKRATFFDSDGINHINRTNCTTQSPTVNRKHQIYPTHSYFLSKELSMEN